MPDTNTSHTWHSVARKIQAKINAAWWLDRFTPMLIALSLLTAGSVLYLRSQDQTVSSTLILGLFASALVLLGIAAWLTSRHSFISKQDTLVRLDDQLHLHNALTTAEHGIGSWPEPPAERAIHSGLDWSWPRVLIPFLISGLVLLAAFLVPVTVIQGSSLPPPSQPLAWEQMEDWLKSLEETDLIEEQALDNVREAIEQLREQPRDEWFSHSSMEASDSLRDSLNKQIEQLGSNLADTERNLDAFQNYSDHMTGETKDQLLQDYNQALKDMGLSQLPLNSEMMQALKNIDPSQLQNLSQLSKEQMDQLRKQLQKGAQACKNSGFGKPGEGLPKLGEEGMIEYLMECNGKGKGPGRGGITRGPGEAPISLGEDNDLGTNNLETVQNPDLSRAAPGDVLGVGQMKHDIDKSKRGPQQGGAVQSTGQGGNTIWRESLVPAEKEVLKRYFKTQ